MTTLSNGSVIHSDIIESFNNAVEANAEYKGEVRFWDFVESDMYNDMIRYYDGSYIGEAFDALAEEYDLNVAWDRLQVLKTDYLGIAA